MIKNKILLLNNITSFKEKKIIENIIKADAKACVIKYLIAASAE